MTALEEYIIHEANVGIAVEHDLKKLKHKFPYAVPFGKWGAADENDRMMVNAYTHA